MKKPIRAAALAGCALAISASVAFAHAGPPTVALAGAAGHANSHAAAGLATAASHWPSSLGNAIAHGVTAPTAPTTPTTPTGASSALAAAAAAAQSGIATGTSHANSAASTGLSTAASSAAAGIGKAQSVVGSLPTHP